MIDVIGLGVKAEEIIKNPAYSVMMQALKADLFDEFCSTKWYQRRKRDDIYKRMQVLSAMESEIETMIQNGQFEQSAAKRIKRSA